MKMKYILTVLAILFAQNIVSAATNEVATLVEHGLFEEEANHQLDAAIGDYKEAIEHFDHERQLAATAIFRLGECYRKQGHTNEAKAQYARILREFPDQAQLAQLSQAYLPSATAAAPGLAAGSPPMPTDEAEFVRKAIESFQTSPDLVNREFDEAVHNGYFSAAEFLLAHGADANLHSPILEAASQGNDAMVRLLLSHGADVNSRNSGGQTPLSRAVGNGFMAVSATLLANGADVNLQSPIVTAAAMGNQAMVELLMNHGAAANSTDGNGSSALSRAVAKGFLSLCHTLVAHQADVNAKDNKGWAPLHEAVQRKDLAAAEFLITNKAQMDAKTDKGETPLLMAMEASDTNMVKLLLEHHADANLETSTGGTWVLTPLGWAIYADRPEMVKLLLEAQAAPNADITSHPLSVAETRARYLFGGALPQWQQEANPLTGVSPLLWATWGYPSRAVEIIQLLLDHGANPNPPVPENGLTALPTAIDHEMLDVVRVLVAHGADVNALDKDGRPPLAHLPSPLSDADRQMEEILVKAGADANYNRRRAIWICGVDGTPKAQVFECPTNSINHHTLLDFLATLYMVNPGQRYGPPGIPSVLGSQASYVHRDDLVPFPDFARVTIHRLDGKGAEVLHVNVTDILQSVDRSKDVSLQPGDAVEIPEQEHKVADQWVALSQTNVTALNKCLSRTVQLVAQGQTNVIALAPSLGVLNKSFYMPMGGTLTHDEETNWLTEALHGRRPEIIVRSFRLDTLVRNSSVLINTWDLSRVRLTRGEVKKIFDLTTKPAPDVWLEDGDVIEISELGETAPIQSK